MKSIKCCDVMKNSNCSFVLHGETAEEVVDNMIKHGKIEHREEMKRMNHEKLRQLDIKVQNILN